MRTIRYSSALLVAALAIAISGCSHKDPEVNSSQSYEYLDFGESQSEDTEPQSEGAASSTENMSETPSDDIPVFSADEWGEDLHGDAFWDDDSTLRPGDIVPEQGAELMTPGNVVLPTNGLIANGTAQGMSQEDGVAANLTGIWFVQKTWDHKTDDTTEWKSVARAVEKNGSKGIQGLVSDLNSRDSSRFNVWRTDSGAMQPVFSSVSAMPGATPEDLRIQVCYTVRYKNQPEVPVFTDLGCDYLTMVKDGQDWKVGFFEPDSLHMLHALAPM